MFVHYADDAGLRGILESGIIRANRKGFVYLTREVFGRDDANMRLFLAQPTHEGRGSHLLLIRLDPGLRVVKMPDIYEFRIQDSIRLDQHEVLYAGRNPTVF